MRSVLLSASPDNADLALSKKQSRKAAQWRAYWQRSCNTTCPKSASSAHAKPNNRRYSWYCTSAAHAILPANQPVTQACQMLLQAELTGHSIHADDAADAAEAWYKSRLLLLDPAGADPV